MDNQPIGFPVVGKPTAKLLDDDPARKRAAKSFGDRCSVERRPAMLLPCQQKLVILQGAIEVNDASWRRQGSIFCRVRGELMQNKGDARDGFLSDRQVRPGKDDTLATLGDVGSEDCV